MSGLVCDACRMVEATRFAGEVKVCDRCGDDIETAVAKVLNESGVFNPAANGFEIPPAGRNYRVRPQILLVAELRAREARLRTGKHVTWTGVIRYALDRSLMPPKARDRI